MKFSITLKDATLSIMKLNIKTLDTIILSVVYVVCRNLTHYVIMLSVIMLSVIMLDVIMPSAIILSVIMLSLMLNVILGQNILRRQKSFEEP
jgi:hypothetical protein